MTAPRLAALLTVVSLAVAPAVASAQSAGDDQYSDPLAGTSTPAKTTPKAQSTTTTPMPSLTPMPPSSTSTSASSTAAATSSSSTTTAATELPRTGADTWLVALLGLVLVLTGIGLRLRTADGRG